MNFYTNVTQWGNYLLLREVVNGERLVRKVKYSPTLYAPVAKPTEYKTPEDTSYKKEISKQYTVSFAYNKGAYQVIPKNEVKDIGK